MRNGVQRNRLQRYKRARAWVPYRVERGERQEELGPRGRIEILDQWTNQLVRVVDEKEVPPVDNDDT